MDDSQVKNDSNTKPIHAGNNGKKAVKKQDPHTNFKRFGRELAMQYLYECDLRASILEPDSLENFWEQAEENNLFADDRIYRKSRDYAERLIAIVLTDKFEIDGLLEEFSKSWDLERMSAVDRNILRVAIAEMRSCEDIPPVVSINEAIEISKEFSDFDSKKFINGILNSIKDKLASEKN